MSIYSQCCEIIQDKKFKVPEEDTITYQDDTGIIHQSRKLSLYYRMGLTKSWDARWYSKIWSMDQLQLLPLKSQLMAYWSVKVDIDSLSTLKTLQNNVIESLLRVSKFPKDLCILIAIYLGICIGHFCYDLGSMGLVKYPIIYTNKCKIPIPERPLFFSRAIHWQNIKIYYDSQYKNLKVTCICRHLEISDVWKDKLYKTYNDVIQFQGTQYYMRRGILNLTSVDK